MEEVMDNWKHRSSNMKCRTCMFFVEKKIFAPVGAVVECAESTLPITPTRTIGRCRECSPTMKGWPAVFEDDWCGAHKIDEEKL